VFVLIWQSEISWKGREKKAYIEKEWDDDDYNDDVKDADAKRVVYLYHLLWKSV